MYCIVKKELLPLINRRTTVHARNFSVKLCYLENVCLLVSLSVCTFLMHTDIDIKIPWFAKLFDALTQTDPTTGNTVANYANICTALDLLAFLLQVLPQNVILAGFKTLHKGLNVCMTCGNTKVVRYVHALLSRLLGMFPPEHGKCMY